MIAEHCLELPYCWAYIFQIFLDHFAAQRPEELKVMLMDNGAFHKARRLIWPSNILPLFLPPYCPELNPAEKRIVVDADILGLTNPAQNEIKP